MRLYSNVVSRKGSGEKYAQIAKLKFFLIINTFLKNNHLYFLKQKNLKYIM